jgi:predicted ester cyclase
MNPTFDAHAFASGYLDAWNRRDEALLRRVFFAPDVIYREIALKETLTGVDAVMSFMLHLATTFPDVRWDVLDVVAESEDKLAIQWMSRRTVNGMMTEAEGVSVMHRSGGRIVLNADFRHRGA